MKKAVSLFAGVLLLIAVLPLPYGYYLFLRVAVFAAAIWLALTIDEMIKLKAPLWIVALLFNPFFPVHLSKAGWLPIDLAAAFLFFLASREKQHGSKPS